jgi:ABC-type thiamin/hydroxymethylpyrimidine transport system permease subunit
VRLTLKELTVIGALGALWGSAELSVGSFVHVWHLPMGGAVLAAFGVTVALIARLIVPRPGSTLMLAVITALLKALSVGGVVLSPMIAIVIEGAIAETVLTLSGRPQRRSFILAGTLTVGWTMVHPLVVQGLIFGAGILTTYRWLLSDGAALLHLPVSAVVAVLVVLLLLHLVLGAAAGLIAWQTGCAVLARRALPEAVEVESHGL